MFLTLAIHVSLLAYAVSGAVISQQPLQVSLDDSDAIKELYAVVGNQLSRTSPIGKPCYPPTSPMVHECRAVSLNKLNDDWTTNQPGGHFYNNWASCQATNQACHVPWLTIESLPENATCHQGSVPSWMVEVENQKDFVRDIEAALDYVRKTKNNFVIRNTGHDWKGRSSAPNSLALWTHRMQAPNVPIEIEKNFVPAGCKGETSDETVLHFGAGQQWGGLYEFAEKQKLAILGGTCPSVGVAGWLQGGGHSPMTPRFGMGVDNIRQLEIYIPANKSTTVIANRCQNKDLFFAMRGGGGGTFGIITKITYKTVERVEVVDFNFTFDNLSNDTMEEYFQVLVNNSVEWSKKGWGGYLMSKDDGFKSLFFNPFENEEVATKQMEPLINFINRTKSELDTNPRKQADPSKKASISYNMILRDSWYDCLKAQYSVHPSHFSENPASRLLAAKHFAGDKKASLVDAFVKLYHDKVNMALMFVAPTRFDQTLESPLHPTWKSAVLQVRAFDKWNQYYDWQKNISASTHFERMHKSFEVIRDLAPDMGISISEADTWEENPEKHFWGEDEYKRLQKIKEQVDPENLLTNYGAINWDKTNKRFACYPPKR